MTAALAGLSFLGLTLLLGGALTRRWLTPGTPPVWLPGVGLTLLVLGWGGQVTLTLSALGLTAPGDVLAYLTATGTGRAMLTGVMGGLVLLAGTLSRWPWGLNLTAALVTAWGVAGVGHGAGHGLWVRGLHAAHVGAMAVWTGGVLALVCTRPLTPEHARRFTPAALGSVAVLAATGLLMSGQHLTTVAQWTGSGYGQTLLVKLTLVALTLGAAVFVRRAFARRAGERGALAREALLLAAVLGATGVLSTRPPPQNANHPAHAGTGQLP